MRFSTGTQVVYGADGEGAGVLIAGDMAGRIVTPPAIWDLSEDKPDGTRVWRLPKGKTLTRIQRPLKSNAFQALIAHLNTVDTVGRHPSLTQGLESEAARLYPELDAVADDAFRRFTRFLDHQFGVNLAAWEGQPNAPFTDDIGPELLVLVNGQPVPLPELPPIYRAPRLWQITQWTAANAMFGPYADESLPSHQQISYMGVDLDDIPNAQSPLVEGLMYYQGARFIIIFEAWVGNPAMPLLRKYIDLLMDGQRPWKTNILP